MLAQNFKSATDLGIEDAELDALIKVLGMLERQEFVHVESVWDRTKPNGFNMGATQSKTACGTVACMGGWANIISGGAAFPEFVGDYSNGRNDSPANLRR